MREEAREKREAIRTHSRGGKKERRKEGKQGILLLLSPPPPFFPLPTLPKL